MFWATQALPKTGKSSFYIYLFNIGHWQCSYLFSMTLYIQQQPQMVIAFRMVKRDVGPFWKLCLINTSIHCGRNSWHFSDDKIEIAQRHNQTVQHDFLGYHMHHLILKLQGFIMNAHKTSIHPQCPHLNPILCQSLSIIVNHLGDLNILWNDFELW